MVVNHHFTRVDTIELKELIHQKIGHQRAEKYFDQLRRFLGLKLSKVDFDKSCIRTIGRENLSLHNRFIRSIIQNACQAKVPPKKAQKVEGLDVKVASGYQRNCMQSLYSDAFALSPRKCRSTVNRDLKFRDRSSPLWPLGKSTSITCEETVSRIQEQQSETELRSLCSRPPVDVASVEDGEEVEQYAGSPSIWSWSPVTAPLGVSVNRCGARKALHCGSTYSRFAESCQTRCELPDTRSLRSCLQKKLTLEGIEISLDSANLLNNGLDVFLKRLIEPCIGVARSRCTDLSNLGTQPNSCGHMISALNGLLHGSFVRRPMQPTYASMLDFRVAMESNPRILGEDSPIQLEKIYNYALEE